MWQRFRAGERGVLGRHLYNHDGQATFDEIGRRYDRDGDFRATVDRYMGDFERLLGEAEQTDPDGRMLQNYLTSETGRVYLLLAHASGATSAKLSRVMPGACLPGIHALSVQHRGSPGQTRQ